MPRREWERERVGSRKEGEHVGKRDDQKKN